MNEVEREPLLKWMREHAAKIPTDLAYREAALDQMLFFRDKIAVLFLAADAKREDYEQFSKIESWHISKSVTLPVYFVSTDEITVVARDNFYNWNVTIRASVHLVIPDYFQIDHLENYLFFEGMEQWRCGPYRDNNAEFSFAVYSKYDLYAIMRCISSQVAKAHRPLAS